MRTIGFIPACSTMAAGLGQKSPSLYEPALTALGTFLGADAFKPASQGNSDSAWRWGNDMWLTVEAKSDESSADALSIDTVRQTNTHLAMLSAERGDAEIPYPNAASIISSPCSAIDSGAITAAQAKTCLQHTSVILVLAAEVQEL